jgi:hydroxymethylpyrimidine/phosphomethylpyrimidine kinase
MRRPGGTGGTGGGRPASRPRVLSIAGSDSGGGAGIQADLKTFSALGVFGMTAVTAVTVQNTLGVSGYEALSPATVADQIRAVATDIGVDAAKTGMLASAAIVEAVADAVAETGLPNLVVDPVSVSKHGHPLLAEDAVDALRGRILPLATLVTPNLPEAAALAGFAVEDRDRMRDAAEAIHALGASAVLVKGGHLEGARADDLLFDGRELTWIAAKRIDTPHTHGTGCVLSSAIAAYLARGATLPEAVRLGKAFVTEAIRHALPIGGGIGPVDPLFGVRGPADARPEGADALETSRTPRG